MSEKLVIIDVSDSSKQNSIKLVQAASHSGILLLKNHTFQKEDIDNLLLLAKEFFDLPQEVKNQYPITENNDGYIGPFVEDLDLSNFDGTGDAKEAFNITKLNLSTFRPEQSLPKVLADKLPSISAYLRKYYVLLHIICRMLAVGLDIKDSHGCTNYEYFVEAHALNLRTHSTLRFVHYPKPHDIKGIDMGSAGEHTDYGSMTFVMGTDQGLQFFDGTEWVDIDVPIQEDGTPLLILNIADVLNFWTDGYLKSVFHRVRARGERYAVACFCHPGDDIYMEPVNSELVKNADGHRFNFKRNGKPLTALEHLKMCLEKTYDHYY